MKSLLVIVFVVLSAVVFGPILAQVLYMLTHMQ